jgi:hypothetical protein
VSSLNRNLRRLRSLISLNQIAFIQIEDDTTGMIFWQVWEVDHSAAIGKYYLRRLISESSTQENAVKEAIRRFRTMRFHEIWDEVGDQKEV